MFCRNCGEVLTETDIFCIKCGFAAGDGIRYCASCGSETLPGATICDICGNPVSNPNVPQSSFSGGQQMQFQQAPPQFRQAPPQFQQAPPQFQQAPGFPQTPQYRQGYDPNQMPYGAPMQGGYIPPNAYYTGGMNYYQGYSYKSKAAAGLLGIFLGSLGVHNFYLGYTGKGVAQLMLTLCSCGVLGVISGFWGFIEGIMLLTGSINTDGNGLPLK